MYPSIKNPSYGIFVKNIVEALKNLGIEFSKLSVIRGKSSNPIQKLYKYFIYYLGISFHYLFGKYDVIYVHFLSHNTPILYILIKIFGKRKKLVINVHGSDIIKSKGKKIDVYNVKILEYADKVVVPSSYFQDLMLNQYPKTTENLYYISPSGGIDPTIFYPSENPTPIKEIPILGFVSRIDARKGWDIFLKALKILKEKEIDFKAVFAGSGAQEENFKKMVSDFDLTNQVNFLGVVKQEELVKVYQSMDLFIFPTIREAESLGLVGLEAMACKVPVIGSKISGLQTYLVDAENGYFFTPGNETELAQKVIQFINLPFDKQLNMKEQAYNTSKTYQKNEVVQQLKKMFEQLQES